MNLFRDLSDEEKAEFRKWARDNYKPGEPICGVWHPVVQEECTAINREHFANVEVGAPCSTL